MKKRIFIGIFLVFSLVIVSCNIHEKSIKIGDNNILGIYLDNELETSIPKKGEAVFSKAVCDSDEVNYYWDIDNWGLYINNLSNKIKCNLYFVNYSGQTTFDFDYTGIEQTFTAPVSGTYRLETWGAQGGNANETYRGGYGGYGVGSVFLIENETIYINVGGMGQNGGFEAYALSIGGYNGGGNGQNNEYNNKCTTGGGGATHVSKISGILSSLENYKEQILIVSGGGGGSFYHIGANNQWFYSMEYGDGGGFIGKTGKSSRGSEGYMYASGGLQTGSGSYGAYLSSFGQGASGTMEASGGGGGFYGGNSNFAIGGGGSGYIGNTLLTNKVMYCYNCEESNEESTKTISTTCSEEIPTSYCAKKGNGYARITLISIDN